MRGMRHTRKSGPTPANGGNIGASMKPSDGDFESIRQLVDEAHEQHRGEQFLRHAQRLAHEQAQYDRELASLLFTCYSIGKHEGRAGRGWLVVLVLALAIAIIIVSC